MPPEDPHALELEDGRGGRADGEALCFFVCLCCGWLVGLLCKGFVGGLVGDTEGHGGVLVLVVVCAQTRLRHARTSSGATKRTLRVAPTPWFTSCHGEMSSSLSPFASACVRGWVYVVCAQYTCVPSPSAPRPINHSASQSALALHLQHTKRAQHAIHAP